MKQNRANLTLQSRILTDADLSLVQGGIGMASTAAKPLLPVILEVIRKYAEEHPAPPAS